MGENSVVNQEKHPHDCRIPGRGQTGTVMAHRTETPYAMSGPQAWEEQA